MHVVVTGGAGNLGRKARDHLACVGWCAKVTSIDVVSDAAGRKEETIVADLTDGDDRRWIEAVEQADAVIHLATTNPAARSGWTHARDSLGITANLLAHTAKSKHCRFVFASSNHAMGLYKDSPIPGSGKIGMNTLPLAGTKLWNGDGYSDAVAYGSSKLFGERLCLAAAQASSGMLTAVSLRIGWCRPGENTAATLGETGIGIRADDASRDRSEAARDIKWFRDMWLSNADYAHVIERALLASATNWPKPAVIVAAVSNNADTPWDLAEARSLIGYAPQDDVWTELAIAGLA